MTYGFTEHDTYLLEACVCGNCRRMTFLKSRTICSHIFSIVLSTLCISTGVTAFLYLALPIPNFILSKFPEIFSPSLKGMGDLSMDI